MNTTDHQHRIVLRYTIADKILFYTPSSGADNQPLRMYIPHSSNNTLRLLVLYEGHDEHLHVGIDKTYKRLSRNYYWPGMSKDVTRYINSCGSCRKNKVETKAKQARQVGWPTQIKDGTSFM